MLDLHVEHKFRFTEIRDSKTGLNARLHLLDVAVKACCNQHIIDIKADENASAVDYFHINALVDSTLELIRAVNLSEVVYHFRALHSIPRLQSTCSLMLDP